MQVRTWAVLGGLLSALGCVSHHKDVEVKEEFALVGHEPSRAPDQQLRYAAPGRTVELSYRDGVAHGCWRVLDSSGQPTVEMYFEDGICRGIWTRWDDQSLRELGLSREEANSQPQLVARRVLERKPAR